MGLCDKRSRGCKSAAATAGVLNLEGRECSCLYRLKSWHGEIKVFFWIVGSLTAMLKTLLGLIPKEGFQEN